MQRLCSILCMQWLQRGYSCQRCSDASICCFDFFWVLNQRAACSSSWHLETFRCHYSGPVQPMLLSGHSLLSSQALPTPSSFLMPDGWTKANSISNGITAIGSQTSLPQTLLKMVAEYFHFNRQWFCQAADLARDCMWKHTWELGPCRLQLWQQPGSAGGARVSQDSHNLLSLARCRQNHWRPQLISLSSLSLPHHSLQSGQTSPMCYGILSCTLFC